MSLGALSCDTAASAAYKRFAQAKPWRKAEFTSAAQVKFPEGDPMKSGFHGEQVRVPISELKNWLEEKLAY